MQKLLANLVQSLFLGIQLLGFLILGLIFVIAPDLAVGLGINYMKFRTAVLG